MRFLAIALVTVILVVLLTFHGPLYRLAGLSAVMRRMDEETKFRKGELCRSCPFFFRNVCVGHVIDKISGLVGGVCEEVSR